MKVGRSSFTAAIVPVLILVLWVLISQFTGVKKIILPAPSAVATTFADMISSANLHAQDLPGEFDFVWLHPPYWNIIEYSDDPADLSTCGTYEHFLERLRVCLRRCYAAVVSGGRLAVLVGDVRRKGTYAPIVRDVLNMEGELGQLRSVVIKLQHNCRSDRVTYDRMEDVPIQHEYCVVFKKPEAA